MKFRIGKRNGARIEHAFDLEQIDGGGIRFSNVQSLSDGDKHLIMGHYGRPVRSKVVVLGEQHFRNFKPGTVLHFEHASYVLPDPFTLMSGG